MSKLKNLHKAYSKGKNLTCITAYDASISKFLDSLNIDLILVGDSLGQVIQGNKSTHDVTLNDIIYHSKCVSSGIKNSALMIDLPKNTYNTKDQALENSKLVIKESKADLIKIEISENNLQVMEHLIDNKIPICAHIGLLPQSVMKKTNFRKYGKTTSERNDLFQLAKYIDNYGVEVILLECIDDTLAKSIRQSCKSPVIGIGSGPDLDGQVAVIYDLLGISFNTITSLTNDNYDLIKDLIIDFQDNKNNDYN